MKHSTRLALKRNAEQVNETTNRKVKNAENLPTLSLECESDLLSDAQIAKHQHIKDKLAQFEAALGNTGLSVGSQVSQFLLIQNVPNGQIVAPPTSQPTLTASSNKGPVVTSVTSLNKNKAPPYKPPTPNVTDTRLRKPTTPVASRESPEIEVVQEKRPSKQVPTKKADTPTNAGVVTSPTQDGASTVSNSINRLKNIHLLNITVRPRNTISPSLALQQRKELDMKVKTVLMKSSQEFVEWLLSEGLVRTQQYCSIHKIQPANQPFKLKLGIFCDPVVMSASGGYVWISECCGRKYVSVYSGSAFGSTPIDKVPPASVLKLIYHWACQTSIQNVETWVKVDRPFISKMYHYLRCICSVILHDKVFDFGFDGTTVELGIVSLGTSSTDGTKKAVKVEILGLYDTKMKSYRLFASAPEPSSTSKQRFMRILKPVEQVVNAKATIICDQSIDRSCLHMMNFLKVTVCDSSENEDIVMSNSRIMYYLRKHVPKMFQSTLSQLSLEQVQLVLDELCWRERFGTSAQAYNSMIEHIQYLTMRETENPGLLHLLDYVAENPHNNWRYKSQNIQRGPVALHPSIINNVPGTNIASQVSHEIPMPQNPQNHANKVMIGAAASSVVPPLGGSSSNDSARRFRYYVGGRDPGMLTMTKMEPYFYGTIPGNSTLGLEPNSCEFKCHLCTETFLDNILFLDHLKWHLSGMMDTSYKHMCPYCVKVYQEAELLQGHISADHLMEGDQFWCRICVEQFDQEQQLVTHMTRRHVESDLPYRCEVCQYATSFYCDVLDHFRKKHNGSPYVQCHLCLTVKCITSASASSFSLRMFQHMQKHTQKNRCKACLLTFYSKYFLQEHKIKEHASCSRVAALQRYEVPEGRKVIMFRSYARSAAVLNQVSGNNVNTQQLISKPGVAMSTTLEDQLNLHFVMNDNKFYCIECDMHLNLENHFWRYQQCTKCSYTTSCRAMIPRHAQVFHPSGRLKGRSYIVGPPVPLPNPLYCACGFSSRSGNHLARHLALCRRSNHMASPYPYMVSASPMTQIPNVPPQDFTHFLTMNMDLDEADDDSPPPPEDSMPISVELEEAD